MKTFWKMPFGLKVVFDKEIQESKLLFLKNDLVLAWKKLERALIIVQPWAVKHTVSHWQMLLFAFKIKNTKEIIGQLPRLFIGGIKSFVGEIPTGNYGGSNVHPLQKMPIPDDIIEIMKPYYKTT